PGGHRERIRGGCGAGGVEGAWVFEGAGGCQWGPGNRGSATGSPRLAGGDHWVRPRKGAQVVYGGAGECGCGHLRGSLAEAGNRWGAVRAYPESVHMCGDDEPCAGDGGSGEVHDGGSARDDIDDPGAGG